MKVITAISIPRCVGTPGEAVAAQIIARLLTEYEISYDLEEFSAGTFHMRVLNRFFFPLLGLEMIFIFFLNLWGLWIPAVILAIIGIIFALRIHLIIPWVLGKTVNVGKKLKSRNYVFRVPSSPEASKIGVTWDFYFLAHWDSKSEVNPVWYLFLVTIIGEFINLIFCVHYLFATVVGALGVPSNSWSFLWGAICGMFTLPQLFNAMGNESAGALDDASGVGICIALARHFKKTPPPPGVHVTFVITGMEEFGDKGGRKFLERHRSEFAPEHTHFVVLDTIGDGKTVYHDSHGLLPVKHYDPELTDAIAAVKITNPGHFDDIKPLYLPPAPVITDHMPFHQAGFKTLIIESSTFKTHSPRDVIAEVDLARVGQCVDLLATLISYLGNTISAPQGQRPRDRLDFKISGHFNK